MNQSVNETRGIITTFTAMVADLARSWQETKQVYGPIISQAIADGARIVQTLNEVLPALQEALKKFPATYERFGVVMLELGWPPPTDPPLTLLTSVLEHYDKHGIVAARAFADAKMLAYMDRKELLDMVAEWQQKRWLSQRWPIVKQAVEAHLAGMYHVSVPAIIPQIEGIIATGFLHQGQMGGSTYTQYAEELLTNHSDVDWDYKQKTRDFITQTLLVQFRHGSPMQSELSRHAILHGGDITYGTEIKSLKAILLFNKVQDAFGLVATPNGNCYHLQGCTQARIKPKMKLRRFESVRDVVQQKLRPCKYCIGSRPASNDLFG